MTNTINTQGFRYNNVRTTEGQQKKHIQQMTRQETSYLQQKLDTLNYNRTTFAKHFFDKDLGVTAFDVIKILKNKQYSIIEYNETPLRLEGTTDKRILVRTNTTRTIEVMEANIVSKHIVELCIVISITNNLVVTGYYNAVDDKHYTINWSRYCKGLQIIDVRV